MRRRVRVPPRVHVVGVTGLRRLGGVGGVVPGAPVGGAGVGREGGRGVAARGAPWGTGRGWRRRGWRWWRGRRGRGWRVRPRPWGVGPPRAPRTAGRPWVVPRVVVLALTAVEQTLEGPPLPPSPPGVGSVAPVPTSSTQWGRPTLGVRQSPRPTETEDRCGGWGPGRPTRHIQTAHQGWDPNRPTRVGQSFPESLGVRPGCLVLDVERVSDQVGNPVGPSCMDGSSRTSDVDWVGVSRTSYNKNPLGQGCPIRGWYRTEDRRPLRRDTGTQETAPWVGTPGFKSRGTRTPHTGPIRSACGVGSEPRRATVGRVSTSSTESRGGPYRGPRPDQGLPSVPRSLRDYGSQTPSLSAPEQSLGTAYKRLGKRDVAAFSAIRLDLKLHSRPQGGVVCESRSTRDPRVCRSVEGPSVPCPPRPSYPVREEDRVLSDGSGADVF